MILVADSGSTKCSWVLVEGNQRKEFQTVGLNPLFHTSESIAQELHKIEEFTSVASLVTEVYFYGASCSSAERVSVVQQGLEQVFTGASVSVHHDLLGAALATYDGRPCISCILGTGSNSCFFDGKEVFEEVPSLGYILGDEGSGNHFGQELMRLYLYKKLPTAIHHDLESSFNLSKEVVFAGIHPSKRPNSYLASFMPFIAKHRNHPQFKTMLIDGFKKFLGIHVLCFDNFHSMPVHFVGSVAHHFSDELHVAAEEMNIDIGTILQHPIVGLVKYHIQG